MSIPNALNFPLPKALEGIVPSAEQIFTALGRQCYSYDVNRVFIRAVDDPAYVGTASPFKAHRFGPPLETLGADGRLPFTWVYLGMDSLVAAWESRLVLNNRGAGNGFHVTRKATENGQLAMICFRRPLRLWSLGEDHSSRLGFQDAISSRDHEACQWFGLRLRESMLWSKDDQRPDGFVYPSHRVKGFPALALADWAATELFSEAEIIVHRFTDTDIYQRFRSDPMCTDAPERDA